MRGWSLPCWRCWMKLVLAILACIMPIGSASQADSWKLAQENGIQSQRAVKFCRAYAHGWLSYADPVSGLLPMTLKGADHWDARNCAADNYPFLVLTAYLTGDYYLKQNVHAILKQEQRLTNRLDSLPDDFLFATQKFRKEKYNLDEMIFGASEYAKDGLMPVTEWLGPAPWLDRMKGLIQDIWKHAPYDSKFGKLPSHNVEVNGELLQTMSRLYWLSGNEQYKVWSFRLADYYLLEESLLKKDSLRLRDHGCEIIGGLSEAYLIAAQEDPERHQQYKSQMYAILDRILEIGVNEDGLMYNVVNPKNGSIISKNLSDGWGYVYNAFLTVAEADNVTRYRDAVVHALSNIHKYPDYQWEGSGADGYADSIEGALNLLNRIPVDSAFKWVDREINYIFKKQRHNGIIEGWYGDGNSARTVMMYGLWKTQGIAPTPWREDMQIGAVRQQDGSINVVIRSEWPWKGRLRFDRPRHRDYFHMPMDYPRINQMPEWFTVDRHSVYEVRIDNGKSQIIKGTELLNFPLALEGGKPWRATILHRPDKEPPQRTMKYTPRKPGDAIAWQKELRNKLFKLLKLDDLMSTSIPFNIEQISSTDRPEYILYEMGMNSTAARRIKFILTIPKKSSTPHPAVVCIHGHGGSRYDVYNPPTIYRGFADALAKRGYVTIATDVGQHKVYEAGRILMGERLWDLMRCVDYLFSRPEVDKTRIGCGGLSLGGEMAMWLGAMDERMAATVSSGFLTIMDQMEQKHCMCWKFGGLRELVDFADIYSLIAPRPLQCQNGLQEPLTQFIVPLAREALNEIKLIYKDLDKIQNLSLAVHKEGHVIDLPSLLSFFDKYLASPSPLRADNCEYITFTKKNILN